MNKVRWFYTASLLKVRQSMLLGKRMCSRLYSNPSLSKISLDFRHLLKPVHWYLVLLHNCWEKTVKKKKKEVRSLQAKLLLLAKAQVQGEIPVEMHGQHYLSTKYGGEAESLDR